MGQVKVHMVCNSFPNESIDELQFLIERHIKKCKLRIGLMEYVFAKRTN